MYLLPFNLLYVTHSHREIIDKTYQKPRLSREIIFLFYFAAIYAHTSPLVSHTLQIGRFYCIERATQSPLTQEFLDELCLSPASIEKSFSIIGFNYTTLSVMAAMHMCIVPVHSDQITA